MDELEQYYKETKPRTGVSFEYLSEDSKNALKKEPAFQAFLARIFFKKAIEAMDRFVVASERFEKHGK